jgi:MFS family permease
VNEPAQGKLATPAFFLLVAAHFLQGLGYASMLLLPLYLSFLGASRTEIGTIMAMSAMGSIAARPAIAWALDVVGRKRTLIVGTGSLALAMFSFYFLTELSPLVYFIRLFMGAAVGALFTGYFTFAADIVPSKRRTEGLALFGISGLAPMIVNPFATQLGIEAPDLRFFYPIVGVATLCSLIPLLFIREAARPARVERYSFAKVITAVRVRSLFSVWIGTAFLGGTVAVFTSFATVSAEHRAVGQSATIWLTYAAGATVVRIFGGVGGFFDRIRPVRLIVPAFACYALAAILLALAHSNTSLILAGLFAGAGHGIGFPVLTAQAVARSPENLRGSSIATLTAIWELAALLFTPLFGAIADHHGDQTMFFLVAAMIAGSLTLWWPLERRAG